ncbi:succinate-semialdehyde dehydrogenase [Deltaproteobacteria bacterium]|nr:succinate-semialdehyde dehydrogenase [Deltaproteobacteria bacterium]
MDSKAYMQKLIEQSRKAQEHFAAFSQKQIDTVVRGIGKALYDNAEALSRLAVEETGMGKYEDKILKNKNKSKITWYKLAGKKSRGVIRHIPELGLIEIAHPMGVVGAITPTTNPTMTPMHNAMIALKGGNSMIVCPHPRAKKVGMETVSVINQAIAKLGAPQNLIQVIPEPTLELSQLTMKLCDVCISTGGASVVAAAYSSGKPAFGVGQGNVQVLVDQDADFKEMAAKVTMGRAYDLGILCTCEQSVICPEGSYDAIIALFKEQGAYYVESPEEVHAVRELLFPDGVFNKNTVGIEAVALAETAGIKVPANTRILMVKVSEVGQAEPLSREKLCPVLCVYSYKTWEQAVDIAYSNLKFEGIGHSATVHSKTPMHVEYAAVRLPVSRIAVNQPAAGSLGGMLNNGLNPTGTLGCGSWGNNSLSENLWYTHLINISRVAYIIPDINIPSDEEIWATE